jgi:tape measure domain-containing protein
MAGFIRKEDIIDPLIAKLLEELAAKTKTFADELDRIAKSGGSTKDLSGLKSIIIETEKTIDLKKQLEKTQADLKKVTEQLAIVFSSENMALIASKEALKKSNAEVSESITGKKKLAQAAKEVAEAKRKEAAATKLAAQEEKLKIAIEAQVVGLIKRLQAENALHAFTIKNKLNPAIDEERRKILELNQTIGKNKDTISDMQRKNVTAWDRVTKAVWQHLAAYVGFQQAINVVRSIFNQTKELDKLSFSFKTIIKDQQELAQTQEFLTKTADAFGQSLIGLSERYMRFRAASLQSNMTAFDTQKIFYSFGKAAAVLGLATDEVSGVFLALEQMISKGKITTEELRRQLGERLSGAFGIFATSMGLSTAELDKFLKAGKILTVDVLPKAAEQLEKAYGIESVNRVENLVAVQGRLNTAWTEFVRSLDSAGVFKTLLSSLIVPIKGLTDAINGVDGEFIKARASAELFANDLVASAERAGDQERFEAIRKGANSITATQVQNAAVVSELNKSLLQQQESAATKSEQLRAKDADGYNFLTKIINENRGELLMQLNLLDDAYIKTAKNAESLASGRVKIDPNRGIVMEESKEFIKDLVFQSKAIENVKQKIKELTNVRATSGATGDDKGSKGNQFTDLEQLKQKHKQELDELEKQQQLLLGSKVRSDEEISLIDKDNKNELLLVRLQQIEIEKKAKEITNEQIATLDSELSDVQKNIAKETTDYIINEDKRLAREREDQAKEASTNFLSDVEFTINGKELALIMAANNDKKLAKANADQIRDIERKLHVDILKMRLAEYEASSTSDKLTLDSKKDLLSKIEGLRIDVAKAEGEAGESSAKLEKVTNQQKLQYTGDFVNASMELGKQVFDNQEYNAKKAYDAELLAAGDSVEGKIIAERKYEAEMTKIRKKQAIADKAQAAFNIGLSTAMAVMQAWATLPPPAAAILTPVIIGIGAIQLATVLAKPIPEYFKGKVGTPETFIAGDKPGSKGASELIELTSGESFLTPDKPTLFSDPKFKGATVYPNFHDKTQRMLANYAVNQGANVFVDMGKTNKHLETIAQNTKGGETRGFDANGRLFVKRNNITTHYV